MTKTDISKLETLTEENAYRVASIINKEHPEWGTKRFNHNDQPLTDGRRCSTWSSGGNGALLFDREFKFWAIVSYK